MKSSGKWIGLGAAAVLVGVAVLFFPGGGSDEKYLTQLEAIYNQFKSLRDSNASEAEFQALATKAQAEVLPWANDWYKRPLSKYPARQHMMWAGKDYLLPMIQSARLKTNDDETQFLRHLGEARSLVTGTASTAPADGNASSTSDS